MVSAQRRRIGAVTILARPVMILPAKWKGARASLTGKSLRLRSPRRGMPGTYYQPQGGDA
jgi:hypothetical protein